MTDRRVGGRMVRPAHLALCCLAVLLPPAALAGSLDVFGVPTTYRVTLSYALGVRTEKSAPGLVDGPVDTMQILFNPGPGGGIGSFGHTGLPTTTNFDDGNLDFQRGALLNNRASAYGEVHFKLDQLGLGNLGFVASGAAHYDQVFFDRNDHGDPATVNRMRVNSNGDRVGPVDVWTDGAQDISGKRDRLLEAYGYGEWYFTDTIALSLRYGRHLAAWGESLFFPGIVSAQGPFDATKAFVPGAEVKEILLPVSQVSMQLALTRDLTLLGYNQFEYDPTEIFPQGDFFNPADLVGAGATFGYGSINPVHPAHCDEPIVREPNGNMAPPGTLCNFANGFRNQPEYILTTRTEDKHPGKAEQWGAGLKYRVTPDFSLGAYHLKYKNHNPHVLLNMGFARVGDDAVTGQPVRTDAFGVRVPVSYTVAYADDVEMNALSFSTVFWVFNIGGELIQRKNIDTSVEADIAGVIAPVATRGETWQAQMSALYVVNPNFLMYDEIVVIGEAGFLHVEKVDARQNEQGIIYSGNGDTLFYDRDAWAFQILALPKGRNVFPGWDIGTPLTFAWLVNGHPSTPGVFGSLYAEGDVRAGISVTAQYLQNLEFALGYNAFFGDDTKLIGNSLLNANPYADHDHVTFSIKYNL